MKFLREYYAIALAILATTYGLYASWRYSVALWKCRTDLEKQGNTFTDSKTLKWLHLDNILWFFAGFARVGVCPVSPTCKAKDEGEPTVQVQGHGFQLVWYTISGLLASIICIR